MTMRIYLNRGIIVDGRVKVCLDGSNGDINFISHAHTDHVPRTARNVIISRETLELVSHRLGVKYELLDNHEFTLKDSGHILGSKSLIMEYEKKLIFTGDFSLRTRSFIAGYKPEKCDILILESTFGKPEYKFPGYNAIVKESKGRISELLAEGNNVSMIGYSLGKAQQLCKIAEKLHYPLFVDEQISGINSIHKANGINLTTEKLSESDGPFIYITSNSKKAIGYKIGYSGWALEPNYKYYSGVDEAFPLSDHADFYDLVLTVKKSNPEKVFVCHGFSREFAHFLRMEGYDATPLIEGQDNLTGFV